MLLLACSAIKSPETLYPFVDHRAKYDSNDIKRVMIAPMNYGTPSRQYLQNHQQAINEYVTDYLKKHQLSSASNKPFEQLWRNAESELGALYNRVTGQKTFAYQQAFEQTLQTLFANNPQLDAVVFTDLIETPLSYQKTLQRKAEWHGVERRIKVEGIAEGTGMSWTLEQGTAQEIDAISLQITIINRQQRLVFQSIGGIQIAQALAAGTKSSNLQRRRDLLKSDKEIHHAIQIAFHPFIEMKGYPKK